MNHTLEREMEGVGEEKEKEMGEEGSDRMGRGRDRETKRQRRKPGEIG